MARKAVQGFPEKSYYDNTRYLGIVATTDPLNEGLFKHMVNFDISDTGQSVQPRKGFLTTTITGYYFSDLIISEVYTGLTNDTTNHKYIEIFNGTGATVDLSIYSLTRYTYSNLVLNTITFSLSGNLPHNQSFIVYNNSSMVAEASIFKSLIAHPYKILRADITTFNGVSVITLKKSTTEIDTFGTYISNPISFTPPANSTNRSFRRTTNVIRPTMSFNIAEWESVPVTTTDNGGGTAGTHTFVNGGNNGFNYEDKTILSMSNKTVIFKDNSENEYIIFDLLTNTAYLADVSAYKLDTLMLPITKLVSVDWTLTLNLLIREVPFIKTMSQAQGATLTTVLAQLLPAIKILDNTKVDHIIDENGISKTVLRVSLEVTSQPVVKLILEMYYRRNQVTLDDGQILPENTLVIEVVDTFTHPTFISTDRNLAVSKSIIPEVFQNLYTSESTRPEGHVTTLGNFVYIYDEVLNYVTNFIAINRNYTIKPYFDLNPAHVDLNNPSTDAPTNHWAYRFDIFNTSTQLTDKNKDVVYRSPWMKYSGVSVEPTEIFTTNRRTTISLDNANKTLNHYADARYVIFVLPKTIGNKTRNIKVVENGAVSTETFPGTIQGSGLYDVTGDGQTNETYASIVQRQTNWDAAILKITDVFTLRTEIQNLNATAKFYLYDLHSAPSSTALNVFDFGMSSNAAAANIKRFIINKPNNSATDPYDIFLEGNQLISLIESLNIFQKENVVFKMLPYASNNVYQFEDRRHTFDKNAAFGNQNPIFYYSLINNAPTFTGYPLNTVIQNVYNSRVYKLTVINPTTWTLQGPESTTPFNINFLKNELYIERGTSNWYKWTGENRFYTETTTFIGTLFKEEQSPSNRNIEIITYQWVFNSVNFWNNSPAPIVYRNVYNNFLSTRYGFYKRINNQTSVEISLNDLKTIAEGSGFSIGFNSDATFGNQTPHYSTSVPAFEADENYIVQRPTTGFFYKQTEAPKGNTWVLLLDDNNNPVMSLQIFSGPFTQNRLYVDYRTSKAYVWKNPSGENGAFTFLNATNVFEGLPKLEERGFFEKGLSGIFYMKPYQDSELLDDDSQIKNYSDTETLKIAWDAIALKQSFNVQYTFDDLLPSYITKTTIDDADNIQQSTLLSSFEENRLLVCHKNILYISEAGRYYWFKPVNKIEFQEEIVKALQYKSIILVFTKQNLYVVYRVETTVTQFNAVTNQLEQNVTGIAWLKQIVLYNLLVSQKYADIIQIFNQMILFYSEDGQLFMIRPSSQIDDQTRFSIQFLNKAANDILKHYDEYINERLEAYAKDTRVTKDQVKIKALVSLNFIKIIYYVPNVITYMLIFDVINNRYTVYDTLTFTNIFDKFFIESGDLLITEHNNKLFFTVPYIELNTRDNYTDMTFTNNFKKEGINCLIDTGNLNLNNHLYKRFRDLHVTFKNLNASNVLFNLETMIDEIIARPFYNQELEVKDINGTPYLVPVPKYDNNIMLELVDINQISETATDALRYSLTNNLFETNNVLMDFSQYNSSKLLTHRTSILGLGKVFRLKLQFISKGLYKLQNFGIIYKERRV